MSNDKKNPFEWPKDAVIRIVGEPPGPMVVPIDYKPPPPKCILCEMGVPKRPARKGE